MTMEGMKITNRILESESKDNRDRLIDMLFEKGKVKKGNFTLKSGQVSPLYINLRELTGQSELFDMMIAEFMRLLDGIEFDIVCGVPIGGVQFSRSLSYHLCKDHIYPREAAKNYGTKQQIDGEFKSGQKVLLVEDVVTTGGSIIKLVDILRNQGLIVEDVLIFVDREQQGKESLEKHGLRIRSVFKLSDFLTRSTN